MTDWVTLFGACIKGFDENCFHPYIYYNLWALSTFLVHLFFNGLTQRAGDLGLGEACASARKINYTHLKVTR